MFALLHRKHQKSSNSLTRPHREWWALSHRSDAMTSEHVFDSVPSTSRAQSSPRETKIEEQTCDHSQSFKYNKKFVKNDMYTRNWRKLKVFWSIDLL